MIAFLYVVRGIPGRDIAATANPGLPVDVLLNDNACIFRGLLFGTNDGPLTLPAGTYDVKVSLADTLHPCSNPALAESSVKLEAGSSVTLVASLSNGAPALEAFINDLSSLAGGDTRFLFAHAADAPAVQVKLTQLGVKQPVTRTFNLKPGAHASLTLPFGSYELEATPAGGSTPIISIVLLAPNRAVALSYFVGTTTNDSVRLLTRNITNVF